MANISVPPAWVPVGRAYYEDALSAAVELTDTPDGGDALPATADCAIIYVSGQPLYWETDGKGVQRRSIDPEYERDPEHAFIADQPHLQADGALLDVVREMKLSVGK